jgi:hypothetical protein
VPRGCKKKTTVNRNRHRKPHKKWFDTDCWTARRDVRGLGKTHTTDPHNLSLRTTFFKSKKLYVRLTRYKDKQYKQNMIDTLQQLSDKDPQSYWKLLEDLRTDKQPFMDNNIATGEWMSHYQRLLCKPPDSLNDPETERVIHKLKSEPCYTELDYAITHIEVMDHISSLTLGTSAIPDNTLVHGTNGILSIYIKLADETTPQTIEASLSTAAWARYSA